MGWILLFIAIFVIYQLVKPKGNIHVAKMSAFDAYLIQHHKESQAKADAMPDVKIEQTETFPTIDWTADLYLGMLKSGKCADEEGLRKEAMEAMNITENELDKLLENYKLKT